MALVALLCPDLLFGSQVEGTLRAAGHEVMRVDGSEAAQGADLVVVDLTADVGERIAALEGLEDIPALGFYPHVDQETRRRAEQAGFDRVVPRSRMARETAALVDALLP